MPPNLRARDAASSSAAEAAPTVSAHAASSRETVLLGALLIVAALHRMLYHALVQDLYTHDSDMFYQAATLAFDYFEFGAVRRGLGGSIAHLLGGDLLHATVRFHVLFAAVLATLTALLYRRLEVAWWTRVAYGAILLTAFMVWGGDTGRLDMAIVTCETLATIALLQRRLAVAVACLCVGLLIHETSFLFGLPLLAALLWRLGGWRAFHASDRYAAAALFTVTLLLYVGMTRLPHLDQQAAVDAVRAKIAAAKEVDWAIYFALSGMRGVVTSLCQNETDPGYWMHPVGGFLAIVGTFLACAWNLRRDAVTAALAALPGFVVLCIIANDISRWTVFACINVWLLQAATTSREGPPQVRPAMAALCGVITLLAVNPRPGWSVPVAIYAGAPYFEHLAARYGAPYSPNVEVALARCDAYWREVLGDAQLLDP